MSDLPQKRASVGLRVREKLKGVSLISRHLDEEARQALTDKANLDGLFAWVQAAGA